ncbi:2-oxoglutarate dehydrogenase E1 component [Catalinimonas alkaloidigena]|uniref:2-oxoglutarate dehydrogenase E1 component n=1 Tax=Catalinimonas alkaloidigena TaxID=1075417 RepID=UPI0024053327|nr:2-oxoglutarate dehydrogenase E1 component [Catalinimonas alkaloidigena]MDF9800631.1 2-oxoglutarate dehydrogenase E1 component [Catalinimonas alkaloidigena]
MDKYSYISNADVGYIDELYKSYQQDPASVDESWQKFFEGYNFSQERFNGKGGSTESTIQAALGDGEIDVREAKILRLIRNYRRRGHLESTTNPVRKRRDRKAQLGIENFGLTEEDLDVEFDAGKDLGIGKASLRKIIDTLRSVYLANVGFEYTYIRDREIMEWIKQKAENTFVTYSPSQDEKKRVLRKLNEAVVFENFLHTKYLGQKRFSLEGGETTIPALDGIINHAVESGTEEVMIGMAHRGRLNVLANIMGKTYEQIFNEFEGTAEPELAHGDGDVKYHLGYSSEITTASGKKVNVKLAPNPSHLEAVDPVVEGFIRAKADHQYGDDYDKVLPILLHGDAALAGQGIVYEVAQMSQLEGYHTGGTIHFIINNQVGFTTDFDDARSSIYSSDVAKVIDSPVLHVNGDDPEAVLYCVKLAVEFRQKFHKDIFIDMVCYRRHGHNESDEPKFTQPSLYNIISKHPNPREVYNKRLIERGDVDAELAQTMDKEFRGLLQDRLNMVKQHPLPYEYQPLELEWRDMRKSKAEDFDLSPETGISEEAIKKIANALTTLPKGFKPIKQIEKQFKLRKEMFFKQKQYNWAAAELMAYGSILLENKIVRIAGQDTERGTFSHRHAVIHDAESNEPYTNLNHIDDNQEQFRIYNSLLSEYGALGFEFGYAMANPSALVIWEAQFGDFANGAQVMIDQFITTSETKWRRMSGVVMLLPHGYEGQGPEHSNARPERFLQLSADYNIIVANITEPSNFFHALRRQLAWPFRKPLVVMSPKSLLRHPKVTSPVEEFTQGRFREIIPDTIASPQKSVKKVLLCSGKIYYDLEEKREKEKRKDVAIIRIEQLHPFPDKQVTKELMKYKSAKVYWVQEEPENMGYWAYMLRTYRQVNMEIISRKPAASPATGYGKMHAKEQEEILNKAFA